MRYPIVISLSILVLALVFGCGSDDDPVAPATQDVNAYLANLPTWEEFWPKLQSADETLGNPIGEVRWEDGEMYVCTNQMCSITETPEAIATFDPGTSVLWLGSLIQGETYRRGITGMEELPIRQRAPL